MSLDMLESSTLEILTPSAPAIVEIIGIGPQGAPGATSSSKALNGMLALRATPTLTVALLTQFSVALQIGGAWTKKDFIVIANTLPDDETNGVVRPDDYATGTNEKVFIQVGGMI